MGPKPSDRCRSPLSKTAKKLISEKLSWRLPCPLKCVLQNQLSYFRAYIILNMVPQLCILLWNNVGCYGSKPLKNSMFIVYFSTGIENILDLFITNHDRLVEGLELIFWSIYIILWSSWPIFLILMVLWFHIFWYYWYSKTGNILQVCEEAAAEQVLLTNVTTIRER